MRRLRMFLWVFLFCNAVAGQTRVTVEVRDSLDGTTLPGATIQWSGDSHVGATDASGRIVFEFRDSVPPAGFSVSSLGYRVVRWQGPLSSHRDTLILVRLATVGEQLEAVSVVSTRSNSRIEELPLKVEVLGQDDLQEENTIKPGNLASLLGDLSIIHLQQTSSVDGGVAVRMQGLQGKYTQLLRDGLPMYDGFSGNFGVLQQPPADLRQVEIIKGSVSTLYGGGAIGGIINLISRTPEPGWRATMTLNRSTLSENNANAFVSHGGNGGGFTCFGGYTRQSAQDVNDDGFSEVPALEQQFFHPVIFVNPSDSLELRIGYSYLKETRAGGWMDAVEQTSATPGDYLERQATYRHTTDILLDYRPASAWNIRSKASYSLLDRRITLPGVLLHARQSIGFFESSVSHILGKHALVAGLNWLGDRFYKREDSSPSLVPDYANNTAGVFLQDGWQVLDKVLIEAGIRYDHTDRYAGFLLPRLAVLYRPLPGWSFRLSSGAGYKLPLLFDQLPFPVALDRASLDPTCHPERSQGLNADINYHAIVFREVSLQLNQAFYYTGIRDAVVPFSFGTDAVQYRNANGLVHSAGTDTYVRLKRAPWELYLGYNHTEAKRAGQPLAFLPQDKFSWTLAYEPSTRWRIGWESSLVANQYLDNGRQAPDYWFFAAMLQHNFNRWTLVLNCENLFDARQSRREALVTGTPSQPVFVPVWGPLEGRVINLSVRFRLGEQEQ